MHTHGATLLTLGWILTVATAAVDVHAIKKSPPAGLQVVPGAYIVELDTPSALGPRYTLSPHAAFYHGLDKRGASWNLRREYNTTDIFVGAAVNVASDEDLVKLASISHVKRIFPVHLHPRPVPVKSHVLTGQKDVNLPADTLSTHKMTGVDKLHAEGIYGEEVNIALIDSGIDYLHPALGGGFGEGFKVYFGIDLVGDDYDGTNEPVEDDDPMDCSGHGTFVAGIIAAGHNEYGFTGVAPSAGIGAYRIFGCKGHTTDDVIIAAMSRAYEDGADVLCVSSGLSQGWSESPVSLLASHIAAKGRVVTASAGNAGDFGMFYASDPGTGEKVISVASVENTQLMVQTATLSNNHPPIAYNSFKPLPVPGSLPIFAFSEHTTDGCDVTTPTPNLREYIVVIQGSGRCDFTQQVTNAASKGGRYALLYSDEAILTVSSEHNPETAFISAEDGTYLVRQFLTRTGVTLSFPQTGGLANIPNPLGGLVSAFSAYGPGNDLNFKPSVAAPGGEILSTFPRNLGGYAVMSGTSFAAPFVAGSSALLLEATACRDEASVASVALGALSRFETTSSAVPSSLTDGDPLETLAQAGAGLINVYSALHYTTIVTPGELLLNDTTNNQPIQTITVENLSDKLQAYSISHVPAGTTSSFDSQQHAIPYPVPLNTNYAKVWIPQQTIQVSPGSLVRVSVTILPPTGVDPKVFPVYSGFIRITREDRMETLNVAYLGVAAKMKDMKILDTGVYPPRHPTIPLPLIMDGEGDPQTEDRSYTFQGSDYPILYYRLLAGSPVVQVDIVDENITPSVHTVGQVLKLKYAGRNVDSGDDEGYRYVKLKQPVFMNGSPIPNGSYRFRLRALKITGNEEFDADYETWISPVITFATGF